MGGEKQNIAKKAEVLSQPLFQELGWKKFGPMNENWVCTEPSKHGKKSKNPEHPADVVFSYVDPYSGNTVYLNTDLKSYATSTLQGTDLGSILKDLAQATECANKSENWQTLYVYSSDNWIAAGLLFIYNHDGAYDKDFEKLLGEIKATDVPLPENRRCFVLGPKRIAYLATIVNDIHVARGETREREAELPGPKYCNFFYPDQEHNKVRTKMFWPSATIATLLGRRIILHYKWPNKDEEGYLIYADGAGDTKEEFLYILDAIFFYQLLRDTNTVQVAVPYGCAEAKNNFEKAKLSYAEDSWSVDETTNKEQFAVRLKKISFRTITKIQTQFSEIALGLES